MIKNHGLAKQVSTTCWELQQDVSITVIVCFETSNARSCFSIQVVMHLKNVDLDTGFGLESMPPFADSAILYDMLVTCNPELHKGSASMTSVYSPHSIGNLVELIGS